MFARGGARIARGLRQALSIPTTNVGAATAAAPSTVASQPLVFRKVGAGFVRGCAGAAGNAEAEQTSVVGAVIDAISTALLVGVCGAGAVTGASYYMHTTEQLEKLMEKREHVPGMLKGTPLETALDYGFQQLLEVRQWGDQQAHFYLDPVSDKLLPDHPPDAQYIPYTLVVDLDDTLICSDWKRERGWRVFKRPGAADFLKHMAQFYEVIIFSDQLSTYVDPIVERLDPNHFTAGRLYRESTQYKHGEYLRDLSKLNRDPGQILYITARPKGAKLETTKPNTIVITPWKLETADTTLLDLMPFLESIVRLNVKDVREVLDSYMKEQEATGKDIPTIFRERQVAFQRMKAERTQAQPRMSRGYSFGRS